MTLWWILDIVLLVVVVPVVVILLKQRARRGERRSSRASTASATPRAPDRKDLDAVPLLLTTQTQVQETVENVAAYGGSLDVILDDASMSGRRSPAADHGRADRARARLLPRLHDLRADEDRQGPRRDDRRGRRDHRQKSEPVAPVVDDINANLDAAVDALEGLLVKKAGMEDAVGLVEGLYPGAAAQGFRDFPDSADDQGAADRRGLHARARSRSPASAARRRSPPPARTAARSCATCSAAASRRARSTPPSGPAARRSSAPTPPSSTRLQMQTPAPFDYERATSLEGAIASLEGARGLADRRRRAQPAADDEAAARAARRG